MIRGKQVNLRPLQESDLEVTLCLRRDLETNRALMGYPFPVTSESELRWLRDINDPNRRDRLYLGIEVTADNSLAGYLSAKNLSFRHGTADFGIVLSRHYRGKGLAREAMELFFNYLHGDLHLRKINLEVLSDNEAAIKLYEKFGFVREGVLKKHFWQNGIYKDVLVMAYFMDR